MEIQPREFKERFFDNLIEIYWRQWTALGVASHVKPERTWIVDLEPLIVSTLAIGLHDKRLLSSSFEWLTKNGEWINLSRLKRIVNVFSEPLPELKTALLCPGSFQLFVNTYNKNARYKIKYPKTDSHSAKDDIMNDYKTFFTNFKVRNVTTEPKLQLSSLIQLLLRSIFGVDARTEILIFLLAHEGGNSNSIAKEIFYNQKNIYTVLERWSHARMVTKISEQKTPRYSLNRKDELLHAIGLKEMPAYVNWTRTFLLLNRLAKTLSIPPWSDDEYLLSSLFRDYLNETNSIGRLLRINIPEPSHFPGKQFFSPFALVVLSILNRLKKGG
jgi:hypothetical protein